MNKVQLEIYARICELNARVEAMKADNQYRIANGNEPCYLGGDFHAVANELAVEVQRAQVVSGP